MRRMPFAMAAAAVFVSFVGASRATVHEYVEDFTSSRYQRRDQHDCALEHVGG